jgi:Protein of unknown function (DUF559)/Transcriptional regulator, AbiEi antitoxin
MPQRWRSSSTPRDENAIVRVATLAATQWGVVALWQLMRLGISRATIYRWLSRGYLQQVHPGVFAVGHVALGIEGRLAAALFHAGTGSALSHTTSAWWWGLWPDAPGDIHVSVPSRRRSTPGVVVHARRTCDRAWVRRLPATTVNQTLLDCASMLPLGDVRRCLAEADFQDLLDAREAEAIAGRGRPGSRRLLQALREYLPEIARTRSQLERGFLELCQRFGVEMPEVNVFIEAFLVDAVWRDQRVIVELDGGAAHSSPAQMERDRQRDLVLRAAGYTVLRYTWQMVTREPERVTADLMRTLNARIAT